MLVEWKVIPSDGHHCIRNYNIQVSSPNGTQWGAQTPGRNHSFLLFGMQLEPLEEYTYCVTANIPSTQTGPTVKQTSLGEVQGMYHKTAPSSSLTPTSPLLAVLLHGLHITAYILRHFLHAYVQNPTHQQLVTVKVINLSAVMTCEAKGYNVYVEWKVYHTESKSTTVKHSYKSS